MKHILEPPKAHLKSYYSLCIYVVVERLLSPKLLTGIFWKVEEKWIASKGERLLLDLSKNVNHFLYNLLLVILHPYIVDKLSAECMRGFLCQQKQRLKNWQWFYKLQKHFIPRSIKLLTH